MANTHRTKNADHLLQALQQCDVQLNMRGRHSSADARLFAQDPGAATLAADVELSPDVMLELIDVLSTLAEKLDLPLPETASA